jgi:phosphatidylinositol-3-phosphatase
MNRSRTLAIAIVAALLTGFAALALAGSPAASARTRPRADVHSTAMPPIHHVWVINLENESFGYTFGRPKSAPYLSQTLAGEGALLTDYYGIGHDSLDNYIAQVSGQAPDYDTGQDCEVFIPFVQFEGENFEKWTKDGQLTGEGCVYPPYVKTVGNQMSAQGLSWKAYAEDMGKDPKRDGTTETKLGPACGHPKLGQTDYTDDTEPANDSYATRHNGFMYFESVIGNQGYCDAHVQTIARLVPDLSSAATTPDLSFVTPNTCNDAHDIPKCQNGEKGGLGKADEWLEKWVPRIVGSPAYAEGGMVVITFDESGEDSDAGGCCGEVEGRGLDDPSHPNVNQPGLYGPGGGRIGAVVLSPFVRPGTRSKADYNHYSLLRTIEDIFGLGHLGDAKQPQVHSFGPDVFTAVASSQN